MIGKLGRRQNHVWLTAIGTHGLAVDLTSFLLSFQGDRMPKTPSERSDDLPSKPTGEALNHDALVRLAEELGRIIGKFLADELACNGRQAPPTERKRKH